MRSLKFGLISILLLFCLVTGIGLLFSSRVTVVRQVDIRAKQDVIWPYINDIKHWHEWMIDSSIAIAFYSKNTSGKNASAQIGNSRATIENSDSGRVTIRWKPNNGKEQESGIVIVPSNAVPNGTTVQWYFTQKLHWYPWERIAASLNEKILGPSMEEDLNKLKTKLDNQ